MTKSLSANIMSRLALRVWKRLSSLKWWQALLLFWTVVGVVGLPASWIEMTLLAGTPIMYRLGFDATFGWIEFYGVLLVFIALVKGLSFFVRELRKLK